MLPWDWDSRGSSPILLNEVTRSSFDAGNRLIRVDSLRDNTSESFGYNAEGNRNAAYPDRANDGLFTYDKVGTCKTLPIAAHAERQHPFLQIRRSHHPAPGHTCRQRHGHDRIGLRARLRGPTDQSNGQQRQGECLRLG